MTMTTAVRPTKTASEPTAEALAGLLGDTLTLYLKTHGYHWNVTGPAFRPLHLMFEEQYLELRDAADEIAERIRALDRPAPGSWRQLARLTELVEDEGVPDSREMVRRLAADHQTVVSTARRVLEVADANADAATVDLATRRIAIHQKMAWMLRATLEEGES
jgi:starvation-inducible DNA-binding protein